MYICLLSVLAGLSTIINDDLGCKILCVSLETETFGNH